MRKPSRQATATATAATPASLGTKRQCPKCSTKFYDFNKEEIECPKCGTEIDPQSLNLFPKNPEPKKAKVVKVDEEVAEETVTIESEEGFESVEDLADSEEDVDIDVDGDDEEDKF